MTGIERAVGGRVRRAHSRLWIAACAAALCGASLVMLPGVTERATGADQRCGSELATITGTERTDSLRGTAGRDVIAALGGDDRVMGLGGDDLICGGAGSDQLLGGDGADTIYGGAGTDQIQGEAGADRLRGDEDSDIVSGGEGNDSLDGGAGTDSLTGDAGADRCTGERVTTCEGQGAGVALDAAVGQCRPILVLGVVGDPESVAEGETITYEASIRNDPGGACLDGLAGPAVAGDVTLRSTDALGVAVREVAMWLELGASVLPSTSGMTTNGGEAPGGCPGGSPAGCTSAIQDVVGNVEYANGAAKLLAPGEVFTNAFRFFVKLTSADVTALSAPSASVRLAVAATTDEGATVMRRVAVTFGRAPTLDGLTLSATRGGGASQLTPVSGALPPGGQLDVPAGAYTTGPGDADIVSSRFSARAAQPTTVNSSEIEVRTVLTTNPAAKPALFLTASPDAVTAGQPVPLLFTVAPRGAVTGLLVLTGPNGATATMRDDGTSGDSSGGDGVFATTLSATLTQKSAFTVSGVVDGVATAGTAYVDALPAGVPTVVAPTLAGPVLTDPTGNRVRADMIVVRFAEGTSLAAMNSAVASVGGSLVGRIDAVGWQVKIPAAISYSSLAGTLERVSQEPGVIGASPESTSQVTGVRPNDPDYGSQSHLPQVKADKAWVFDRGDNARITVAVIDTGVDRDHPDLVGALLSGTDLAVGDGNPEDTCGHGSHVAGIVGASTNNGRQVAGVNWNAALLPVKVFPDVPSGGDCFSVGASESVIAAGIRWAVDHGAKVLNLSLRGPQRNEDVVSALQYAWLADRVVIAAAGNDTTSTRVYPGGYERAETFTSWFGTFARTYHLDVMAVGNVDSSNRRASDSNFGSWVDIAAPGQNVLSTHLAGGKKPLSGTSMAAPVVAGVASLILSRQGTATEAVRTRLLTTAAPLSQGVGPLLDAYEATFNGSFENGLATWTRTGTVQGVQRLGPITPRSGGQMMMLSTGPDGSQTRATLVKTIRVRSDAIVGGQFTVQLRYNYVSEEYPEFVGTQFNDTFTIDIRLPNGQTRRMVSESVNTTAWTPVSGIDFPGGDRTVGQSNWRTASLTIPASALGGSFTFDVLVADQGDAIYDSVALVDAITVS